MSRRSLIFAGCICLLALGLSAGSLLLNGRERPPRTLGARLRLAAPGATLKLKLPDSWAANGGAPGSAFVYSWPRCSRASLTLLSLARFGGLRAPRKRAIRAFALEAGREFDLTRLQGGPVSLASDGSEPARGFAVDDRLIGLTVGSLLWRGHYIEFFIRALPDPAYRCSPRRLASLRGELLDSLGEAQLQMTWAPRATRAPRSARRGTRRRSSL